MMTKIFVAHYEFRCTHKHEYNVRSYKSHITHIFETSCTPFKQLAQPSCNTSTQNNADRILDSMKDKLHY